MNILKLASKICNLWFFWVSLILLFMNLSHCYHSCRRVLKEKPALKAEHNGVTLFKAPWKHLRSRFLFCFTIHRLIKECCLFSRISWARTCRRSCAAPLMEEHPAQWTSRTEKSGGNPWRRKKLMKMTLKITSVRSFRDPSTDILTLWPFSFVLWKPFFFLMFFNFMEP